MTNTSNQNAAGLAVITGASSGIGAVYADRLAGRGHDLLLVARRADRLEALARSLSEKHGVKVETLVADLADAGDLAEVADRLAADERVTVLVNNAGTATLGNLTDSTPAEQDAMIDVNITALTRLSVAVLPGLLARNTGTIINIGSVLSFHTLPASAVYSGTKAYVMNFTWGLQEAVSSTNVRVQLVMPAVTATDLWELSGVPLTVFNDSVIMSAETMVDASLAGLDKGETMTLPSVADDALWTGYNDARLRLFGATNNGKPAPRYGV